MNDTLDEPETAHEVLDYLEGRGSQKEGLLTNNLDGHDFEVKRSAEDLAEAGLLEIRDGTRGSNEYVLTEEGQEAVEVAETADELQAYVEGDLGQPVRQTQTEGAQVGQQQAAAAQTTATQQTPGQTVEQQGSPTTQQPETQDKYPEAEGLNDETLESAEDQGVEYVLSALEDGIEGDDTFESAVQAVEGISRLGDQTEYNSQELVDQVYDEDDPEHSVLSAYSAMLEE